MGHLHSNLPNWSEQFPPFMHGAELHSFNISAKYEKKNRLFKGSLVANTNDLVSSNNSNRQGREKQFSR